MRRVVILANSRKLQGRCVAGIDLASRCWVRPLGSLSGGALSSVECIAGSDEGPVEVGPGDIVDMADGLAAGSRHHPEDIESTAPWRIVGQMTPHEMEHELHDVITVNTPLLGLSTPHVALADLDTHTPSGSLALARCSSAVLYWRDRPGQSRQLRACVRLTDVEEDLALTDPRIETRMSRRTEVKFDRCLISVSLGEPYTRNDGGMWCSKLIAALLPLR